MEKPEQLYFTPAELATILHGLRIIQENANGPGDCMAGCCDHFDDVTELNDVEIDNLCESLNPLSPDAHKEKLLRHAQELQNQFWDAIGELQEELDINIDASRDLNGVTIASLTEAK